MNTRAAECMKIGTR